MNLRIKTYKLKNFKGEKWQLHGLKKSPTSSTDDTKTREIVENILKDIEKTKEEGCKESKKFDKYEGDVIVSKEKIGN